MYVIIFQIKYNNYIMKPRSKTSRKPLKKKQNGKRTTKRTTKKNTKKHKQTHQARSKKSRGMIGGEDVGSEEENFDTNEPVGSESNNNEDILAQKKAQYYPLSLGALIESGKFVGVFTLIVIFMITRN